MKIRELIEKMSQYDLDMEVACVEDAYSFGVDFREPAGYLIITLNKPVLLLIPKDGDHHRILLDSVHGKVE